MHIALTRLERFYIILPSYRVENGYTLVNHCGVNVLMMEYRGYGRSGGDISEQGQSMFLGYNFHFS